MTTVAIIPARGGSRRIPLKNIKPFFGKPIIAHSILAAQKSLLFDEIWVSTDSTDIGNMAFEYGTKLHPRSQEYARNEVGTQEVVAKVIEELWPNDKSAMVCCIYPTAPLMSAGDLIRGRDSLLHCVGADFAMSVCNDPLCDAAQFYWGHYDSFVDRVPLIDTGTIMVPIERERVCDINYPDDFNLALRMYATLHNKPINAAEFL